MQLMCESQDCEYINSGVLYHLNGIFDISHVNKSKATRTACLMIMHQIYVLNGPVARYHILYFTLCGVQTQAKYA